MSINPNSLTSCLTAEQTLHFYFLWRRLLRYVNQCRHLAQDFLAGDVDTDRMEVEQAIQIRDALWENPALLVDYIRDNPDGLTPDDLGVLGQWQNNLKGNFIVMRVTDQYALFSKDNENISDGESIYAVKGLESPLDDVLSFIPCFVNAVLLPFENVIIYDGLLKSYQIYIGNNMQESFMYSIADAEERGAIVYSLTRKPQPEDRPAQVQATNERVLKAYDNFLHLTLVNEKTIERHLVVARSIAGNVANQPEPRSLRQLEWADLNAQLQFAATMMKPQEFKQAVISLKKLVRFLLDTGRMDWDQAHAILFELKQQ